ncbi:MAG: hypothetical protein NTW03_14880 [Verrucomicrobia bacterium]|nr:hypothetical protein [Verrucomicrobiota bacterium]
MKAKGSVLSACGIVAVSFLACASRGVRDAGGIPVTEIRPDEKGWVNSTDIESQDMVRVSDQMARGILGCDRIAQAARVIM